MFVIAFSHLGVFLMQAIYIAALILYLGDYLFQLLFSSSLGSLHLSKTWYTTGLLFFSSSMVSVLIFHFVLAKHVKLAWKCI